MDMYYVPRFVFIHLLLCFKIVHSTEGRCDVLKPDTREEPGPMNAVPENFINIFPDITVNVTGRLYSVTYFAARTGPVYISFWNYVSNGTYNLSQKVLINSQTANVTQTHSVPGDIIVEHGSALGVHYNDINSSGIIYCEDSSVNNNTLPTYRVISRPIHDTDWMPGMNVSGLYISPERNKSVALHLKICNCLPGKYGLNCVNTCSGNCFENAHCSPFTGSCEECAEGYDFENSSKCNVACAPGTYGLDCNNTCIGNCYKNSTCSNVDGSCQRCKGGFDIDASPKCDISCSNRQFGPGCSYMCHCKNGGACDPITGFCDTEGCENGWQGHNCSVSNAKRVPEGGVDGTGGLKAGVIIVFLVLIAVVTGNIFLVCRRIRREPWKKYKETDDFCIQDTTMEAPGPVKKGMNPGNDYVEPNAGSVPNKPSPATKPVSLNSNPIQVDEFHSTIMQFTTAAYHQEYSSINKNQLKPWTFASNGALRDKNKFKNILPYDENRVVLQCDPEKQLDSYINASHIKSYGPSKTTYIASQGPQEHTIDDFFRMLWQENIRIVVMLTNVVEKMKIKCVQYWPENGTMTKGGVKIEMTEEINREDFVARHLKLVKGLETRDVHQWHYVGWPDHGVPRTSTVIFNIMKEVNAYHKQKRDVPILVHCSAGVGRTGTYISLDYLSTQAAATNQIDVLKCVNTLRTYRISMVQTAGQYEFIYRALNQHLELGEETVIMSSTCTHILRNLVLTAAGKSKLQKQFKFLNDTKPNFTAHEKATGLSKENKKKNRDLNVIPAEGHRIMLEAEDEIGGEYINAVMISDHIEREQYAVTQIPLPHTVKNFWRLLHENNIQTTVCLEQTAPEGHEWLPKPNGPLELEEIRVECKSNASPAANGGFSILNVNVGRFVSGDAGMGQELYANVNEMQECEYANTPDKPNSASASCMNAKVFIGKCTEACEVSDGDMASVLALILAARDNLSPGQPMAVVCRNGASNSGLFIACDILHQIMNKQEFDICNVVQIVRARRPEFIPSLEQYLFLHHFAEYIVRQQDENENLYQN